MAPFFKHKSYINFPILLRVIGLLLLIEAGMMAVPLIASLINPVGKPIPFLISLSITAAVGFALKSIHIRSREMGKREAILLTSLTWVILSLFGMLPFIIGETKLCVTDAFFETMSGFTTTGMSVIGSLDNVPKSIILWRCITQWFGGMGIILFTLAVVPMLNFQGGIQLFNAEVTGITHDKLSPRVSHTAKSLWIIYVVLTFLLIAALLFSEMTPFDAVCYGLSTMSTGGFAAHDMSIGEWDNTYIKLVMSIFMFLGGVNFALIFKGVHRRWHEIWGNTVFRWYICWIVIAYVMFCINVFQQGLVFNIGDLTIDPLFQAVSFATSTGLTEPNFDVWGPLAEIIMIVLIFTGACAGSTSGGAKIDRLVVLMKFIRNEFYRLMHPGAVTTVVMNGKGTSYVIVQKTLGFLFIYIMIIMLGGTILSILGLSLHDSFFYSLSAISNAGLGTEVSIVSNHYTSFCAPAKWLLTLLMLTGRLELYTVLLLFTPIFWRK